MYFSVTIFPYFSESKLGLFGKLIALHDFQVRYVSSIRLFFVILRVFWLATGAGPQIGAHNENSYRIVSVSTIIVH